MSFVQSYALTWAAGKDAALEVAGCEGATLLRDNAAEGRYLCMETFIDSAAHPASAAHLPKGIFSELLAMVADKPEVRTSAQLVTNLSSQGA